jgi:hypothetical protein
MTYRGPGFLANLWLRKSDNLLNGEGEGLGGAKLYDDKKAWSSINHSISSDLSCYYYKKLTVSNYTIHAYMHTRISTAAMSLLRFTIVAVWCLLLFYQTKTIMYRNYKVLFVKYCMGAGVNKLFNVKRHQFPCLIGLLVRLTMCFNSNV